MDEDWLSPMNKLIWIRAFKNKEREVTLRDGRQFKISYSMESFFSAEPAQEYAWVECKKEGAPRGWFRMSKVTSSEWVNEETQPKGGMYIQYLDEFIQGGEPGVSVTEQWPALEGRLASSIRQGFTSAIIQKGSSGKNFVAKTIEGKVYLFKESVASE